MQINDNKVIFTGYYEISKLRHILIEYESVIIDRYELAYKNNDLQRSSFYRHELEKIDHVIESITQLTEKLEDNNSN